VTKAATPTLTAASIIKMKPAKARKEITDGGSKHLRLVIFPSGNRSFVTRFRDSEGKNVKMTLGPFDPSDRKAVEEPHPGAPLLLSEARRLVATVHHLREAGHDVVAERRAKKADDERKAGDERDNAYPALLRRYIDEYARPRTRRWREGAMMLGLNYPSSGVGEPDVIDEGLAVRWRSKSVASITRHDVYDVVEETTAYGVPGLERRREAGKRCDTLGRLMHSTLSGFFKWAMTHQKVDENPCQRVHRPPAAPSRERVLSPGELRALWLAAGKIGYPFGPLARLLVLVGLRVREAAKLRWDEIDLDHAVTMKIDGKDQTVAMPILTIPASRSKNKKAHQVPLAPMALDLIKSLPRFEGPFVFSFWGGGRPVAGIAAMKRALDEASGLKGWRLHDVRRSFATALGDHGLAPPHIIEKLLNHLPRGVTAVYQRGEHRAEKLKALTAWSAWLEALVEDKEPESNVRSLVGRKTA
jgi:integrase